MVAVGWLVHCSVQLACFQAANLHCLLRLICLHVAPLAIEARVALSIEGLPLLPLPCGGCPLLHYHRGSHHPSSLTSQCPSSSLSIPARAGPATLHCVTFPNSAVQCTVEEVFTVHCFSAALSSALMDPAMQSDQGSAQTPAHCT